MKREEIEFKIRSYYEVAISQDVSPIVFTDKIMKLIDEYTKPKTKKKTLEERKEKFTEEVYVYFDREDQIYFDEFIGYWTEHNKGGQKMRFEMSKNQPFNIKRRLATWKKNQKNYGTTTTKETRVDAFKGRFNEGNL